MKEHPYREITITDICRKAQITRNSFYRNCSDKKSLLCYYIDNAIRDQIRSVNWTVASAKALYEQFFAFWKKILTDRLIRPAFEPTTTFW